MRRDTLIGTTAAISALLFITIAVRAIVSGFDYGKTFKHMSLPVFLFMLFVGSPLCGAFIALVAWLSLCRHSITIENGCVSGKSIWWRNSTIPFEYITKLVPINGNGAKGTLIRSSNHGSVFISNYVEQYDDLIKFFEGQIAKNRKDSFPGSSLFSPRGDS